VRREESGSLGSLRESNRERVIEALRMIGVASRSEVARWTGLSRSTVSSIVSELQLEGVVIDRDGDTRPATGGGRPPALIALDPRVGLALGIDFGKRHLAVAVADLSHDVLAEEWREMREDYEAEEGIRFASDLVDSVLEQAEADRERILGVGMGLPSPIHRTGLVGSSAILPGWSGTRGGDRMAERLGLPVRVRNDADLGALAEATWGAGRDRQTLVYLKLSHGIGAGIVIGGELFTGVGGTAGEIGHTTLDETGDLCRCGSRGCLETFAAGAALARLLGRSRGQELDLDGVLRMAAEGDPACRRALRDAGRHIGVALANLCNLVNPERIVVGGSMGYAGDLLLDPIREAVGLRAIPSAAEDVEVVPGELGERAELLGAVALVLHEAGPAWNGTPPAQGKTAEVNTT
jgi:predicted NBD/HSP70 family sugar kinase